MKKIVILVFLTISRLIYAQNPSYQLMKDSLPEYEKKGYKALKKYWFYLNRNYKIDPIEKKGFLALVLKNGDKRLYKRIVRDLIKNDGWYYSQEDLDPKSESYYLLNSLITEQKLDAWTFKKSNQLYPKWIKKNPKAYYVQKKLESYVLLDQYHRAKIPLDFYLNPVDSNLQILANVFHQTDYENFIGSFLLKDSSGILPNNFDSGFNSAQLFDLLLWHNLGYKEDFERYWELVFPLLEKTFFAGKINNGFLWIYDNMCNRHFGYQYYGFLKDVPVKDQEHLAERRKKYGLL